MYNVKCMDRPLGYIYKTTIHDSEHKLDGCYYYGQKRTPYFSENYRGSGKKIKEYIRERGEEKLVCQLLEWGYSGDELNALEKKWISTGVGDNKCLNIKKGGIYAKYKMSASEKRIVQKRMLGNQYAKGYHHSESFKRRFSDAVSKSWKNGKHTEKRNGKNNSMWGKTHTEETKQKISEKVLLASKRHGKQFWWNNGKRNMRGPSSPGDDFVRGRLKNGM